MHANRHYCFSFQHPNMSLNTFFKFDACKVDLPASSLRDMWIEKL